MATMVVVKIDVDLLKKKKEKRNKVSQHTPTSWKPNHQQEEKERRREGEKERRREGEKEK